MISFYTFNFKQASLKLIKFVYKLLWPINHCLDIILNVELTYLSNYLSNMIIWNKFKYGVFDVDGTIVDIMPIYTELFYQLLKRNFDIPENISKPYYLETAGTVLPSQFHGILKQQNIPPNEEKIKTMVSEFFKESAKQNPLIFPGVYKTLKFLNQKGIKLFAMTGSRGSHTIKRFEQNKILQFFSLILGSEKIPKGPRHIEEFSKFCNVPLKHFSRSAFLCGDAAHDMEIAKEAGIYPIGITNTVSSDRLRSAGASTIIKNFKDLLNIDIL